MRDLDLKRPIYRKTAAYGHFGRALPEFTWEQVSRLDDFKARRRRLIRRAATARCWSLASSPTSPGLDKQFDYLVPAALADRVASARMVRVPLHGRRVGGWVVARRTAPTATVAADAAAADRHGGPASARRRT